MRQGREPTEREISDFVSRCLRVHRRVKEHSGPHVIADCLACQKRKHLYVNLLNGFWDCKVCEASGNLWKLADLAGVKVREAPLVKGLAEVLSQSIGIKVPKVVANVRGLDLVAVERASDRLFVDGDEPGAAVRAYLRDTRGFDDETIKHWRLGVTWIRDAGCAPEVAVGIPYVEDGKVPLVKMRNLATSKDDRKFRRTLGGHSGLFNADAVRDLRQVVLVEGELDAISLWQLGITNVASTSLGAKKTIPDEWMETLAGVEDIVLWYDEDDKGQEAAQALIQQLGTYRCRLASMPFDAPALPDGRRPKDANDLLKASLGDPDIASAVAKAAVKAAVGITNASVVRPSHLAGALLAEIDKGEASLGISTGWVDLDRAIRGVRRGELTLVTGHTGHGKTTWTVDLMNNLAEQGHPVLMSALENGSASLARKLFQGKLGHPISEIKNEGDRDRAIAALARLDEHPVFLIDRYGRVKPSEIVDAIKFAKFRHGVRYVMIDHLHFLGKEDSNTEKLDHLEETMSALATLAHEEDIHIFLLAHPRGNVPDDTIPDGSTVKGVSAAKQDADNIFTVFRVRDVKGAASAKQLKIKDALGRKVEIELGPKDIIVQVSKTRHDDADDGVTVVLEFDRRTLRYGDKHAAGAAKDGQHGQTDRDLFSTGGEGEGEARDPFDSAPW